MDIRAQVSMVFHFDKCIGILTRDAYCVVRKMKKLEWQETTSKYHLEQHALKHRKEQDNVNGKY